LQQSLEGNLLLREISALAFSPNGCFLASWSVDHTVRLWDIVTGALLQTITFTPALRREYKAREGVTSLEFSGDGSYLNTNIVSFNIPGSGDQNWPIPSSGRIKIFESQWIMLDGIKALWLPCVYRPTCSAMKGATLALGHTNGQVSFLGFL
jgi:WD40 repeat protein